MGRNDVEKDPEMGSKQDNTLYDFNIPLYNSGPQLTNLRNSCPEYMLNDAGYILA